MLLLIVLLQIGTQLCVLHKNISSLTIIKCTYTAIHIQSTYLYFQIDKFIQ